MTTEIQSLAASNYDTLPRVGWADPAGSVRIQGRDVAISRAFARRINRANMGQRLRGRTISGLLTVVIGPRFD